MQFLICALSDDACVLVVCCILENSARNTMVIELPELECKAVLVGCVMPVVIPVSCCSVLNCCLKIPILIADIR